MFTILLENLLTSWNKITIFFNSYFSSCSSSQFNGILIFISFATSLIPIMILDNSCRPIVILLSSCRKKEASIRIWFYKIAGNARSSLDPFLVTEDETMLIIKTLIFCQSEGFKCYPKSNLCTRFPPRICAKIVCKNTNPALADDTVIFLDSPWWLSHGEAHEANLVRCSLTSCKLPVWYNRSARLAREPTARKIQRVGSHTV